MLPNSFLGAEINFGCLDQKHIYKIGHANPNWELQQIELSKARLELEQRKLEVEVARQEAAEQGAEAQRHLGELADAGTAERRTGKR